MFEPPSLTRGGQQAGPACVQLQLENQPTVQLFPLSVTLVGVAVELVELARYPKDTEPFAGIVELHAGFFAVTVVPDWVAVAFQAWVSVSPLVNVHLSSHGDTAVEALFAMVTAPWKPLLQLFVVVNVTLQLPAAVGVAVGVPPLQGKTTSAQL